VGRPCVRRAREEKGVPVTAATTLAEPTSLCADDHEDRTLVIVQDGKFWVPIFAFDLACALVYPDLSANIYDIAVLIARKRMDWIRSSRESRRKADTMLEELRSRTKDDS
jgi:hypothetical protein